MTYSYWYHPYDRHGTIERDTTRAMRRQTPPYEARTIPAGKVLALDRTGRFSALAWRLPDLGWQRVTRRDAEASGIVPRGASARDEWLEESVMQCEDLVWVAVSKASR